MRGATEPTKNLSCADKFYTSGAMLERLVWHVVHGAAPAEDRDAASHIFQGRARWSPSHALYAQCHPSPGAGPRSGRGRGSGRRPPKGGTVANRCGPGLGHAALQGSIPAGLATAPLWAPLGAGSPDPLAPAPARVLAAPADPAAMSMRDS